MNGIKGRQRRVAEQLSANLNKCGTNDEDGTKGKFLRIRFNPFEADPRMQLRLCVGELGQASSTAER